MSTDVFIHELAVVEDGANIGSGTKVWHHAHVRSGATVGTDVVIGKNVFIDSQGIVGNGCKLQNNVSIFNGVTLEDNVFVGPSAVFTNDLLPRAANANWKISPTTVRRGASIGANATIVANNELGAFCMIGAGSVVTRSVESHELVVGNPARRLGWVCECGEIVSRNEEPPSSFDCGRHS